MAGEGLKYFTVVSWWDGLLLHAARVMPPKGTALRGVVLLVHGMSEHKERYAKTMRYLAAHGYACVIYDHRGHGHSVASRRDLGYMGPEGDQALISDAHQMLMETKKLFPAMPVHVLGHSMGSLIVRCLLQRWDDEMASLTVLGCVGANALAPVGVWLARALTCLVGERHRSRFLTKLAFGAYNQKFQPATSDNAWICSDMAVVEAYDANPLCRFTFTLNGYEALFKLVRRCYQKEGWRVGNPELPILMISGADDPCMNGISGLLDAADFLRARGYRHVQVSAYPGMRHEVLNERGKEAVWEQVVAQYQACESHA